MTKIDTSQHGTMGAIRLANPPLHPNDKKGTAPLAETSAALPRDVAPIGHAAHVLADGRITPRASTYRT